MSFGHDAMFVVGSLIAIPLGSLVLALALMRIFPELVGYSGVIGAALCGTGAYLFLRCVGP